MTCVVGNDGSSGARAALALARQLAEPRERIVALHVREHGSTTDPGDLPSGVISAVVDDVDVAEALVEVAAQESASLIAVGSPTDHRGRLITSTVADALLRTAPCPVLVVPDDGERRVHTIGVAYDARPESRRALLAAEEIALRLDASLIVMRAAGHSLSQEGVALRRTAARSRARGLRASSQLLTGPPAHALAAAAEHVDLLVLGSRGTGPVHRVALGSVAHDLIEGARGPVLVTPRSSLAHPLPTPA